MKIKARTKGIRKLLGQAQSNTKDIEIAKKDDIHEMSIKTAETPEKKIYKTVQYKALKKMIKEGNFTTAVLTARALNIDNKTLNEWLKRKDVQKIAELTISRNIKKIEDSRKWEAGAWILDRIAPPERNSTNVQINNYIEERTSLLS